MKVSLAVVLGASCVTFACTQGTPTTPQTYSIPVQVSSSADGHAQTSALNTSRDLQNFRTHLDGAEEVPVRDTEAQGQANFKATYDSSGKPISISYKLNVANIENVTQAHIHLAKSGISGPIVVWLYPAAPPSKLIPGRSDGTIGEGEITASTTFFGPLAGKTLKDLLTEIKNGNAYVNVHTSQFGAGEIRGQID